MIIIVQKWRIEVMVTGRKPGGGGCRQSVAVAGHYKGPTGNGGLWSDRHRHKDGRWSQRGYKCRQWECWQHYNGWWQQSAEPCSGEYTLDLHNATLAIIRLQVVSSSVNVCWSRNKKYPVSRDMQSTLSSYLLPWQLPLMAAAASLISSRCYHLAR